MYYGDVFGWIVSLKLGDTIETVVPSAAPTLAPSQTPTKQNGDVIETVVPAPVPTSAPTQAPTRQDGDMIETVVPAPAPTLAPAQAPTRQHGPTVVAPQDPEWPTIAESKQQNSNVKRGLTLGGSIALILVAAIIGIGASVYILTVNQFKTRPHPQQERHLPLDAIDDHDVHYLQPHDHPGQHPDPYEDAMISKIQPTRHTYTDDYDPGTYHSEDLYRKQYSDDFDNYSHAPADRISQRLGTSNKIMPISAPGTRGAEDYSYGASLLL